MGESADDVQVGDAEQGRWRPGLRLRLLALVVLAFVPALLLVLYNRHEERQHAIADGEHQALAIVQQVADVQSRTLHSVHALLTALAETPEIMDVAHGGCGRLVRRALAVEPDLANIGLINLKGRLICSAEPVDHAVNLADRPYFRRALRRDDFAVGNYQIGRIVHVPVLVGAHPVPVVGKPRAVVFAAIKLKRLAVRPVGVDLPPGAFFSLHDSQYHILARYPGPIPVGVESPVGHFLSTLPPETRRYSGMVNVGGRPFLLAFASLPKQDTGNELHAVLMIPAQDAFARANEMMSHGLLLLGLASLAVLLLGWVGGEMLVLRPVRRLRHLAGRLAGGELAARTGMNSAPGEIGALAGALDTMATALQTREAENREQALRIERLNRIYRVLSAINGAIIRIRDREQLLSEACRIAVELGNFSFAWVGMLDASSDWVKVVAHAGAGEEFAKHVRVSHRAEFPEGQGTVGRALRAGVFMCSNDIEEDYAQLPVREAFLELGVRSVGAFPLVVQDRTVGILVLHARESDFFDEGEIRLLEEVAADTALGLEHIEREGQLSYLANWDPLTTLPNRTLFCDRLEQVLLRAEREGRQPVAIAVDLANLGEINDLMGRHVGDQVLKELAVRLESAVRDSDVVGDLGADAGRIGGHAFGLLLDVGDGQEEVRAPVARIRHAIEAPILVAGETVTVSTRLGAAVYPEHGRQGEVLLRNAEFSAHNAEHGRAQLRFYSEEMDSRAQERHRMEGALRRALAQEEFSLEYQPKVDARTGRVVGAEALLRWRSAELGPVRPDRFIPVLEQTGMIAQVGYWVLETAARQVAAWRGRVPEGFVMAVNVACPQLREERFAARAVETVRRAGAWPTEMELEITESRLMENFSAVPERLGELKAQGFRIAIDDFGTGYSSLSYLREFPVDTLKIDRAFIRNIVNDPGSLSIVRTMLSLARTLQLDVVAEGVEDASQLGLLAAEGCQYIQGFHFSRSVAPEPFLALARQPFMVSRGTDGSAEPTLLVIDDEPNIIRALQRTLRGEHYRMVVADDPTTAFEVMATQPVQVVLADLRMPVMSGTEFLRRVRSMYPHTVRMILTGRSDVEAVTEAVNEGFIFKFVSKPWEEPFLRGALREAFEVARSAALQRTHSA